jgi:hypothetical protein
VSDLGANCRLSPRYMRSLGSRIMLSEAIHCRISVLKSGGPGQSAVIL